MRIIFPVVLFLVAVVVYFVWGRPWLIKYQLTAGIINRIDTEGLTGFRWFVLWLKGLWTSILLFATSMLTACWGLIQSVFGIDPTALKPFQDSSLWKTLFADEQAIRIAAIATLAAAFITLKGKLADVKKVPEA